MGEKLLYSDNFSSSPSGWTYTGNMAYHSTNKMLTWYHGTANNHTAYKSIAFTSNVWRVLVDITAFGTACAGNSNTIVYVEVLSSGSGQSARGKFYGSAYINTDGGTNQNVTYSGTSYLQLESDGTNIKATYENGSIEGTSETLTIGIPDQIKLKAIGGTIGSNCQGSFDNIYVYETPKAKAGFFAFFCESWQRHDKLWRDNKLILPKDLGFSY